MPKIHSTQPNYLRVSCHFINLHAKIEVIEYGQHRGRGRPRKDSQPTLISHIKAEIIPKETAITIATEQVSRFILATNVLDADKLSNEDVLRK
ncbi:hypothetical protein RintRC_4657 [Richelia intracellularis]|nr:hypothetical protein RintRC_4657 [Richelia intracellularis]